MTHILSLCVSSLAYALNCFFQKGKVSFTEYEGKITWGMDLASAHEKYVTGVVNKGPVGGLPFVGDAHVMITEPLEPIHFTGVTHMNPS